MTLLEDEARYVGRVEVPESIFTKAQQSPVVILEATQAERIARIIGEYVFEPTELSSRAVVRQELEVSLNKLAKRLGGVHMAECLEALAFADHEQRWFSLDAHTPWIDVLLRHYYDKLYDRAMTRLARPIAFQGCAEEVLAWFAENGE
jgi:tRNA 2-selenouridine synthase